MKIESTIKDESIPLKLHTWVGSKYRISSIYRQSSAVYYPSWYWETFVFEVDGDKQTIIDSDEGDSIEQAAQAHIRLYQKYVNE